jgi:hypothetical protein
MAAKEGVEHEGVALAMVTDAEDDTDVLEERDKREHLVRRRRAHRGSPHCSSGAGCPTQTLSCTHTMMTC